MESVKYFKFELESISRDALKLINSKYPDKFHYGKSKYYYGSNGTCKKDATGLNVSQIISAKEMIELLSPKKEAEIINLVMEINYNNGVKLVIKFDNKILIDVLKNKSVKSVFLKQEDPLFLDFEKIINGTTNARYKFNQVKELFNK
jgi:hypothetical protein